MKQTIMSRVELLENIAQHTCTDCLGRGEVFEYINRAPDNVDIEVGECITCVNGYVE